MKRIAVLALVVASCCLAVEVVWVGGRLAVRTVARAQDDPSASLNGDTNGDGQRDISDAVYLLSWLFSGGPEPIAIAGSLELDARVRDVEGAIGLARGGEPDRAAVSEAVERLRAIDRTADDEVWNQPLRKYSPLAGGGGGGSADVSIDGVAAGTVLGFHVREELSRSTRIDVILELPEARIGPAQVLGRPLRLSLHAGGESRVFSGEVTRCELAGMDRGGALYSVTGYSALHRLSRGRKSKTYQAQSDQDIVALVLQSAGILADFTAVSSAPALREHVFQYQESDLDFMSRLMEEDGIHYTVEEDEDGKTTVRFGDGVSGRIPAGGEPIPYLRHGGLGPETPQMATLGRASASTVGKVTVGGWDHVTAERTFQTAGDPKRLEEEYDFTFDSVPASVLLQRAERRLELLQEPADTIEGTAVAPRIRAGRIITVGGGSAFDGAYYITKVVHRAVLASGPGGTPSLHYGNEFEGLPEDAPHRPPGVTPRPRIHGVQPAMVVGRAGETTTTDELGRVKVRFYWDREGPVDDTASGWIRVAQPFGGWFSLPEVGDEVLVAFENGDPDRPYVLGRLHNGKDRPPLPR